MVCDARTRSGGYCRRHALAGRTRCRLHGGFWSGRRGPLRPEHVAALQAGRQRWVERTRQL